MVSVSLNGKSGNSYSRKGRISSDNRYVTFQSRATDLVKDDTNGCKDIFVRDLKTGKTTLISLTTDGKQLDGDSCKASITADMQFMAFKSAALNAIPEDDNDKSDIFILELDM